MSCTQSFAADLHGSCALNPALVHAYAVACPLAGAAASPGRLRAVRGKRNLASLAVSPR